MNQQNATVLGTTRQRHATTSCQRPSVLAMEREVCASLARGNISLQRGEYITADDVDKLQADLTRYFAAEESVW
ncbi:MAG: hypothetical protein ACRC46_04080 [Thermoguttaceae bacterium]